MSERGPLARLWAYAAEDRRRILGAGAASVANKLFDLAPPALIGMAVDVVVNKEASLLGRLGLGIEQQLIGLTVLTVLIWGLESLFEYLLGVSWRGLAQHLQHRLRLDTFRHIQRLDAAWYQEQRTGELLSVLNDDVNQLERFLDGGANDLLQVITTTIAVSISFFALAPSVAWLALLPIPLILWGSFRFQARIAPRYATVRQRAADLGAQLGDNLSGIETIRAFVAEEREAERIEQLSLGYQEANRDAIRLSAAFSPLIRMVIVVGFCAILIRGGQLALAGTLAVGSYSVMVFLTQRLLWPLTRLGATFDLYQRAMASTRRILDLLDLKAPERTGRDLEGRLAGAVEWRQVDFAYPGRSPLLNDFSLSVEAGRTLALVGATGSGKSTLVRLLLGLYTPSAGGVWLDGAPLASLSIEQVRRQIGLVSQNVVLFPGTIAENIAYGRPDAGMEAIVAAARLAEADGFIRALPAGYETRIGERGQQLSGGQRQRISIARALLIEPAILILDEATSAVDNETEAAIQRSLLRIARERTIIAIAHRLSTIRQADEIVVLDEGQIVERGTHEALLARGGAYARLWAVQTGAVSEAA